MAREGNKWGRVLILVVAAVLGSLLYNYWGEKPQEAVALPAVEVHLSDIDAREPFRRISYPAMACIAQIKGQGFEGYAQAVRLLKAHLLAAQSAAPEVNR